VDVLFEHIAKTYPFMIPKCQINEYPESKYDCSLTLTVSNNLHTHTGRFNIQSPIESIRLDALESAKDFLHRMSLHQHYYTVVQVPINFNECKNFKMSNYNGGYSLTNVETGLTIDIIPNPTYVNLSVVYQLQESLFKELKLEFQPWFHSGDRTSTENKLALGSIGTYCVRHSSVENACALTYRKSINEYKSALVEKWAYGNFSGDAIGDMCTNSVESRSIKGLLCSSIYYLVAYWKLYGLDAHHTKFKWTLLTDTTPIIPSVVHKGTLNALHLSNCIQITNQFLSSNLPVLVGRDIKVGELRFHQNSNIRYVTLKVDLLDVTLDLTARLQLKNKIIEYFYNNIQGSCDIRVGDLPNLHLTFDWFIDDI
jgi:hypothetical protein